MANEIEIDYNGDTYTRDSGVTLSTGGKLMATDMTLRSSGGTYSGANGITITDSIISHTNSVTAQTTQAVYPIKFDAQGHITGSGSAVTIPTTGTSPIIVSGTAISHADSGATAGSYGSSSGATLAHSGTFTVPYVTVDAKGHVTAIANKAFTLPSDSDTKVTVTRTTGSAYYPLLVSANTATATYTGGARSGDYFRLNPSTRAFLAGDTGLNVYCATAAATAAKTVDLTGFALKAPSSSQGGSEVFVTFAYTNSATTPTLNVNGTGAKTIQYLANGQKTSLPSPAFLAANQTYRFWYDGTNWITSGPRKVESGTAAPTGGNSGDIYIQTATSTTIQTSGNWKYITRQDGVTECWYKASFNSGTGFTYWGGCTYKDVGGVTYPVTFSEIYNVQISLDPLGSNG